MEKQNNNLATIGDRISYAILIRNKKQATVCKETGINPGLMTHYRKNYCSPKSTNIYLIAKSLDVSEAWLLGYNVPMDRFNPQFKEKDDARVILSNLINTLSLEECEIATRLIKSIVKGE